LTRQNILEVSWGEVNPVNVPVWEMKHVAQADYLLIKRPIQGKPIQGKEKELELLDSRSVPVAAAVWECN
jgi:hypothetical protein